MNLLYLATTRLRKAQEAEQKCEQALLEALERSTEASLQGTGTQRSDEVVQCEAALEAARAESFDALTVLQYYQQKGQQADTTELWRLVFHSRAVKAPIDEEELLSAVSRWSDANAAKDITGLMIATQQHGAMFTVLEGPREAITTVYRERISRSSRHSHCTQLSLSKVHRRDYQVGLKLHMVQDELLAAVLERVQLDMNQVTHYVPEAAAHCVAHGGDPEGIVPTTAESVVVCVALDTLGGAPHRPVSYVEASKAIERLAAPKGVITSRFGDSMTVVFPLSLGTTAVTTAKNILAEVPHAIVAIAAGPVTHVSGPHCWALGDALRAAEQLVFLAETDRRSLIVTPSAMDSCSKAHHKFMNYTIDGVLYYTLQTIGDSRLGREQIAEEEVPQYMGYVAEVGGRGEEAPNVIEYRPMSHKELIGKLQQDAVVRGALTTHGVEELFRTLDPGNVGWTGKEQLRKWLSSAACPYPLFDEVEAQQIHKWISGQNSFGSNLFSLEEFRSLCLKLQRR